jgi:ferredoxin-NADP reductase
MSAPWRVATVVETVAETATARTLLCQVPGWPGHRAGQHVDLQLRADDGYVAWRSYSLSCPDDGSERIALTVQRLDDGEVSPYLCDVVEPGDLLEVRGPLGKWFVWPPPGGIDRPILLFAGGSGVVPLMAMVRERDRIRPMTKALLVYSVRSPDQLLYADELARRSRNGLLLELVYTRRGASGQRVGRLDSAAVRAATPEPGERPVIYVCGPTGFVETVADALVDAGHPPEAIRTERFGGQGG